MAKQLMFDEEGRRKVGVGLRAMSRTVQVTIGPTGRNVLLERKTGAPLPTKDGVAVAKEVEMLDPIENVGARLAREVAEKTHDQVGDGTTTSVLLAEAMFREGLRHLTAGAHAGRMKRGIERAVEAVVAELQRMSRPVKGREDHLNVARVSSHFDEAVAAQVADAIVRVGREGVITVEEGKSFETTMEFVDGLQIDKGYISPYFINKPENLTVEFDDALLLITDRKVSNVRELVPILEQVATSGRPLLLIAEEVEGEALAALVLNRLRGVLRCAAVKAPAFGDRRKAILQDIAVLTGGAFVSDDSGLQLEKLRMEHLGRASRIVAEKEKTTIVGGQGDRAAVERRIAEIRAQIKKTTSDYDREKLEERLSKIVGGVAIIKVGGSTEVEIRERKARVEDAVHAVKAAAEEGIVPGGGTALLRAEKAVTGLGLSGDEGSGARALVQALSAPLASIASNAGHDASVVVAETREKGDAVGFDAERGEFVDPFAVGLVDPLKVVRCALQNAASVASMLLTSGAVIAELKEKKKPVAGAVA